MISVAGPVSAIRIFSPHPQISATLHSGQSYLKGWRYCAILLATPLTCNLQYADDQYASGFWVTAKKLLAGCLADPVWAGQM